MSFLDKSPISLLDPSPNDCVFSVDPDLYLSSSFSLHSNDYESDLELSLKNHVNVMTSCMPFTHPLNTPKTIQTPSSLVDSLLVSMQRHLFLLVSSLVYFSLVGYT